MGTGGSYPEGKAPGHAVHSPPSSVEFKNVWSYTSTSNTSPWRGAQLTTGATLPLPVGSWKWRHVYVGAGIAQWATGGPSPGRVWEFFSSPPRPDRPRDPPSLLSNAYQRLFCWG